MENKGPIKEDCKEEKEVDVNDNFKMFKKGLGW